MQKWYYELMGEEFGPVAKENISQLLSDGVLGPKDRVRADGATDWRLAEEIAELNVRSESAVLPTPDAMQMDVLQSLDDIMLEPSGSEQVPAVDYPDIDSISFAPSQDPNAVVQPPVRQTAASATPPSTMRLVSPETPVASSSATPSVTGFYVETLGQQLGPLSETDLRLMVTSGAVSASDTVGDSEVGPRIPAAKHPVLIDLFEAQAREAAERRAAERERRKSSPGKKRAVKKEEKLLDDIVANVLLAPEEDVRRPSYGAGSTGSSSGQVAVSENSAEAVQATATPTGNPSFAPSTPPSGFSSPAPVLRSPSPSSKSSSGGGVSMGMIAGVVAVLCVVAVAGGFATGVISLPQLSMDTAAPLQEFKSEYLALTQATFSETEWAAFRVKLRPKAQEVVQYLDSVGVAMDSKQKSSRFAAIKFMQVMDCPFKDKDMREQKYEEFVKLMAGAQ